MSKASFHYEQRRLENNLVALEPFDPEIHIPPFLNGIKTNPDLFTYISFPTMNTEADFLSQFYDKHFSSSPGECLYVIFDKLTSPAKENYAGIICLSSTDPINAITEIGIITFPVFQRTHVATNAIGLLLQWTLDPPSAGGLGLRRVEWKTHADNEASRRAALRMGFDFEGIARWNRVFPGAKVALPVDALEQRNGTKGELPGRHTAIYSIVWDEWDDKRSKVIALMEQKR